MSIGPKQLKVIVGILAVCSLVMGGYLFSVYRETSKPAPVTDQPTVQAPAAATKDPGRAFATASSAAPSAEKGGSWSMNIDTNTWATCLVDMYRPDEQPFILEKEAAKAAFISPGKFIWTWKVPSDAQPGTWVARIICGTHENLATADQAIEVK